MIVLSRSRALNCMLCRSQCDGSVVWVASKDPALGTPLTLTKTPIRAPLGGGNLCELPTSNDNSYICPGWVFSTLCCTCPNCRGGLPLKPVKSTAKLPCWALMFVVLG